MRGKNHKKNQKKREKNESSHTDDLLINEVDWNEETTKTKTHFDTPDKTEEETTFNGNSETNDMLDGDRQGGRDGNGPGRKKQGFLTPWAMYRHGDGEPRHYRKKRNGAGKSGGKLVVKKM